VAQLAAPAGAELVETSLETSAAPASRAARAQQQTPPPSLPPKWDGPAAVERASRTSSVDEADVVVSVENYNSLLGAGAAAEGESVLDTSGLNVEECAICCSMIILGPAARVRDIDLPSGQRPRHFECGHALHADCFAIYCASGGGRSCPICALDAADAGGGRDGDESGDDAGGRSDARFDRTRHRGWVGERSGPDDGGEGGEGGYDDGYGYDDEGEEDAEEHREGESAHRYSRSRRQHQEEELERREELELLAALQMSMDEYSRSPRGGGEEGADEPAGEGEAALPASRAPP